ncbi:MAG TPA: hypothetical protein VHK01_05050 [Lacipirellulaceae bacterium]|nr:hypothetical protein [Lacipirellulaceae bacterium]
MDEPQTWSKRIGLTRGKAVIVAILAVTLTVVIYVKYVPSSAAVISSRLISLSGRRPAPKSDSEGSGAAANAKAAQRSAAELLSVEVDESRWKSPDLSVVLAYDPFALPAGFPQPKQGAAASSSAQIGTASAEEADIAAEQLAEALESLRMELEELQQRGVHVIVRGRDQYVAMIGERTIHVGDEINGFTVTAIEPDHVRVERKVQK